MVIIIYDPADEFPVRLAVEVADEYGKQAMDDIQDILDTRLRLDDENGPEKLMKRLDRKYKSRILRHDVVEI